MQIEVPAAFVSLAEKFSANPQDLAERVLLEFVKGDPRTITLTPKAQGG